ncbi:hypothetical protein QJS10_CPA08g01768 [Acorus calamus]|uniref:Uncharacterized protein n=1 Tax=Acorus calamus TaxID=4465 RepID=A0AAV9EA94_ACOCL|nr:hypothetical protein QJS10_CPA08g01768 [Acorus calamus]
MASKNSYRDDSLSSSPIAVSDSGGALVGDAYPDPPGSQIGSAAGSFQNDVGPLGGVDSGGGGSGSSSDAEFGFGRAEFGQSPLAGTVQIYERHVFLCYKTPDVWPAHVEAAEFDRLPRLLSAALLARKGEMKRQIGTVYLIPYKFIELLYGYVTPDDVPILLEQHIGKGEIVDRLWRGQMGLSEEDQKKAQAFRLQLPRETSEREKSSKESKQPIQQNAVANGNTTKKINCCQGSGNNISCCGNPLPSEEKPGNTSATEHEAKPINSYRSSKSCFSRKSCSMPTWFESWEPEDTYAAIAVVAAIASVAVAIRCYRQL